jgi:hypothetical protein
MVSFRHKQNTENNICKLLAADSEPQGKCKTASSLKNNIKLKRFANLFTKPRQSGLTTILSKEVKYFPTV